MNSTATKRISDSFMAGFLEATGGRIDERRVGAELKFPLVTEDGAAVSRETVDALWRYLVDSGWKPDDDGHGGRLVGARKAGEKNDTVASCETGYCKTEFSLAHSSGVHGLLETLDDLKSGLRPFLKEHACRLLCYGIHPVTPPSSDMLMKKMRAGFWDKALPSNNVIPRKKGDDVHLFTVNACSHVHVSVSPDEAVRAVNVLNGFAGSQISLTAHSGIAGDWAEGGFKCLSEKLWDWWEPVKGRVGVPEKPFTDLEDYVSRICALRPIYVKRGGKPVILTKHYESFSDYYADNPAMGITPEGLEVNVTPEDADISTHNSCYWYTARISRYYTVENRVFDQQPPDSLLAPAALTLGLISAGAEAWEEVSAHDWSMLRQTRDLACRHGLEWSVNGLTAEDLAGRMLGIAELGLKRRSNGEEQFLAPLRARLEAGKCPADFVAESCAENWPSGLIERQSL